MTPEQLELLKARTEISRELRINNDNLGFDSASEARLAILDHPDWQERWPDHTPELCTMAERYYRAWQATKSKSAVSLCDEVRTLNR